MREDGWYWVKCRVDGWIVAQWYDGFWCEVHKFELTTYQDSDYLEIDETRITRD